MAQNPLRHWAAIEHVVPLFCWATHAPPLQNCPLPQGGPSLAVMHVPVAHVWHAPQLAAAQQVLSTQKWVRHWSLPVQLAPWARSCLHVLDVASQ